MEAQRMKEREEGGIGLRVGKEGGDGGLIFHNCMGAQRLQGSRRCLGFGPVTAAEGSLWSSVCTVHKLESSSTHLEKSTDKPWELFHSVSCLVLLTKREL